LVDINFWEGGSRREREREREKGKGKISGIKIHKVKLYGMNLPSLLEDVDEDIGFVPFNCGLPIRPVK